MTKLTISGLCAIIILATSCTSGEKTSIDNPRERISINEDWRFFKYGPEEEPDPLIYEERPEVLYHWDSKPADSKPTVPNEYEISEEALKPWILPSGNDFIRDPAKRHTRPEGNPGEDFLFVKSGYDDGSWENLDLPHDWAVGENFYEGPDPVVGGGMGRLPVHGVGWYRKKLDIPASDTGKRIVLEVDGAMSYAMVWLNGKLAGGWPFGYSSFQLDLTPYVEFGGENQLAIRVDNPNYSSRWYPGGGIYRNVWLTKTNPVHLAQWGTFITTSEVTESSARIKLEAAIDNESETDMQVAVETEIFFLHEGERKSPGPVAAFETLETDVAAGKQVNVHSSLFLDQPLLWGPPPSQTPNLYLAVTTIWQGEEKIDQVETRFGIRDLRFDPNAGVYVNNELIKLKGVNLHHDLGALGAAFNARAAERQLEILREMGCNAIRTAHNPPAPELLELTDRMGFLVMDESFDVWERKKTPLDFHLVFDDWHEQDLRAMVRRDRNCPSVIMWSIGNEVGEQYTDTDGADLAQHLKEIVLEEDPTRPVTSAMNWAKPFMPMPPVLDVISLNYQGQGIRQFPEFEGTDRIRTKPQFPAYHETLPDKVILSSETASAFSSRGIYYFPVSTLQSDYVRDGRGGNSEEAHVNSYELHAVDFGASADKVFASLVKHPYVAGEFVWTGFDHLGEPTPYYQSRSSYCGILDMAGFKKDRFYLYQSHWRPDLPMVHILPHWNWPERIGKTTPVHIFTSGDEAELFLNGKSLGRKKKGPYEYRLRWDDVIYEPGELKAVAYKEGEVWAEKTVITTDEATKLDISADRKEIRADGTDLAFITVRITDENGLTVPRTDNLVTFEIDGPGEIVATDNGDPTDFRRLTSPERNAFSGMVLAILRTEVGTPGNITVRASADGLESAAISITRKLE